MAATRAQKLDMKHGFMKTIVKNQIDRDNYDKEVKASKPNKRGLHLHNAPNRPKKPDAAVYIPPPRKEDWECDEVPLSEMCNGEINISQRTNTQDVNIKQNHPTTIHKNPTGPQDHSVSNHPTTNHKNFTSPQNVHSASNHSTTSHKNPTSPQNVHSASNHPNTSHKNFTSPQDVHSASNHSTTSHKNPTSPQDVCSASNHPNTSHKKPSSQQPHNTSPAQHSIKTTVQSQVQGTNDSQTVVQQQTQSQYSDDDDDDDDEPKLLFIFEFEDKDGKRYKQYVIEGVSASIVAQRMGYDRRLPENMIRALERRLQEEIDKRTKPKS